MEPEHHEHHKRYKHHGSVIELVRRNGKIELYIDGEHIRYGRMPDGKFFLKPYAFDWRDDLVDLARRYIDYRLRRTEAR